MEPTESLKRPRSGLSGEGFAVASPETCVPSDYICVPPDLFSKISVAYRSNLLHRLGGDVREALWPDMEAKDITSVPADILYLREYFPLSEVYLRASDGTTFYRVSAVIATIFPSFDADKILGRMSVKDKLQRYGTQYHDEIKAAWEAKGTDASSKGTAMHALIERCLLAAKDSNDVTGTMITKAKELRESSEGQAYAKELQAFEGFVQRDLKPWYKDLRVEAVERFVCSESLGIAGTIDAIFSYEHHGERRSLICDWKRAKAPGKYERTFEFAGRRFKDTKDERYSMQINIYNLLLIETKAELPKPSLGFIMYFHPDNQRKTMVKLETLDTLKTLISSAKETLDF